MEGGCTCRHVRYRIGGPPLIVHACHCRWCQRETGSAHALNALFVADDVVLTSGQPEVVNTPSASGRGQLIARCPACHVAVWSHYPQGGPAVRFVRVGTMDDPAAFPPDIHIYTSTKLPWVVLPEGARAVPEFYDARTVWPEEARARVAAMRQRLKAQAVPDPSDPGS
ncbi:GFA family protein [Roseomonas terrae]|uniref:GFA family protein n=1 Tax=Neoroseomonas terrae TaxID=424799 RepID=A0ABS5EHY0_9PROT|nr:GFA family protein [Neoroseomonas terrae]MBR0650638.1 GFA family protein [Neoroseomonas terrae]